MELGAIERDQEKKYIEKGYSDLGIVLLRNGGMFIPLTDGTKSLKNKFWKIYVYVHNSYLCGLLFILLMSVFVERKDVEKALEACHYAVMILSLTGGNIDFLFYRQDLNILLREAGRGFFKYDEEEPEVHKEMRKKGIEEVKLISRIGVILYYLMGTYIGIVQPYIYYLSMKDEPLVKSTQNPFLPIQMYFPWDTFTQEGFIYAYTVQMLGATLVVNNVIANGFSYVNLMVLFRSQLQILNHSVKNIETRVVERYQSKYGTKPDIRKGELETDLSDALKKCYMECLKQNIMHHQALLRWERTSRKMVRVILLFVFFNASILMGSTGYLLLKNLHSKVRTVKFLQLLVTEIFHTYLFCYYGEQVSKQSEDLLENLYNMQWFVYGKDFNKLLSVMLTVTVKPVRSLTAIFNTPCSLETFNNLMSTAYSYFSLINGMKDNL